MRHQSGTFIPIVVLAAWLGAALSVSALVAPAAFAVLPTRAMAGALIGRILPPLFWSGLAVGIGIAAREWMVPDDGRARAASALLLVAAMATAQLVIAPRLASLRATIAGPVDALATSDPVRLSFGRLHGMSVACLGVGVLAALLTLALFLKAALRATA